MKKILLFLSILVFGLTAIVCNADGGETRSITVNNKTMKAFVKGSGALKP